MALFRRARPHFTLEDAPMTRATTGRHFGDMLALPPPPQAPRRTRIAEHLRGHQLMEVELARSALFPERYEYAGKVVRTRLEAECLFEYGETFRMICVGAGSYLFPDEKYIGNLASQVSDGFLLSFKATDEVTIKRFPK